MNDRVVAFNSLPHTLGIENVGLDAVKTEPRDIFWPSRSEIIEEGDSVTSGRERSNQVRPNKAGSASYENTHRRRLRSEVQMNMVRRR
jgi:hypothetical protein